MIELLDVLFFAWIALLLVWVALFVSWLVSLWRLEPLEPYEAEGEWGRRVFFVPRREADGPEAAANHWIVPPFGEPFPDESHPLVLVELEAELVGEWWKVTATYGFGK